MVLKKWIVDPLVKKVVEPLFANIGLPNNDDLYFEIDLPKPQLEFKTLHDYEVFMKKVRAGKKEINPGDLCSIDFELNKKVNQFFQEEVYGPKFTKSKFGTKLIKALATATCLDDLKWAIGSEKKVKQLYTLVSYDRRSKRDYPFNINFNYWFSDPYKFKTSYFSKEDQVFVEPNQIQFSSLITDDKCCPCDRHKFNFLVLERYQGVDRKNSLYSRYHERMVYEMKRLIEAPNVSKWRTENFKKVIDYANPDWYKHFLTFKSKLNLEDFDSYYVLIGDKQCIISIPHASLESFTNKVFIELVRNGGIQSIRDVRRFYAIPQISLQDFLKNTSI